MRNSTRIPQVENYLAELDAALQARGAGDRTEIVDSIREHIESALSDEASSDEVAQVLRDLGDPLAVAADAGEPQPAPKSEPPSPKAGTREPLTQTWVPAVVVLLTAVSALGAVFILPAIATLAGAVMLWMSALWTKTEKWLGTLLLPLPGLIFSVIGVASVVGGDTVSDTAGDPDPSFTSMTLINDVGVWALPASAVLAIVVGVLLVKRGLRRAAEK